ncbi:hypothetical protein CTJ08_12255 [Staphylococcus epidermidis]|uniref:Uncharacterized protein n=1 Tax=Staphylococcus epidermidis TaxID=1282 RepID=A0AAE5V5Y4_STAEP|nr:hypothetical protein CTJ00_13065 [Staphylococcus epidermidis]PIH09214.1 hypothetical protein CTJ08_12255 [Staphylococcus epidermidis]
MIIVRNLTKNLEWFYDFFKKNSHKMYKKIMYILLNSTVIAFILLLILKLIFDFPFLNYIHIFFRFVFLLGLIIGSIPDFIEKKVKAIILDLIIIIIMTILFFVI